MFTTPAIRAAPATLPEARLDYLVEPRGAPVVRHNPHLARVIVAERPRGLARLRYDLALARRLRARQLRCGHRLPRRAAQRVAGAGERRAAAHRLRHSRAALDVHDAGGVASRIWSRRGTRSRTSGTCSAPLGDRPRRPRPRPRGDGGRRRRGGRGRCGGWRPPASPREHALIVVHVSAGNPFRRWPPESFAAVAAALARGRAGAADHHHARGRRKRDAADAWRPTRRDWPATRRRRSCAAASSTLAELQVIVARAATLHRRRQRSAARRGDDRDADRRALRATLPARSMPWRDAARAARWRSSRARCPAGRAISGTCVPGDFRCLTARDGPTRSIAAATALLEARR